MASRAGEVSHEMLRKVVRENDITDDTRAEVKANESYGDLATLTCSTNDISCNSQIIFDCLYILINSQISQLYQQTCW
jgi:hypothetical protein